MQRETAALISLVFRQTPDNPKPPPATNDCQSFASRLSPRLIHNTAGAQNTSIDSLCGQTLRIGIDPTGRTVLLYLIAPATREVFRTFLGRVAPGLIGMPAWTLRLVFPRGLAHAYEGCQRVVRDEWETPLHPHTIEELNWYFERRRDVPSGHYPLPADARFEHAAIAFDGPRFDRLYRRWVRRGAAALTGAVSPVMANALTSGRGRIECIVLDHAYEHLAPVIDNRERVVTPTENDTASLRATPPFTLDSTV